jgi:integrase
MGTITARARNDGTTGYTAQIRIKKGGKIVHTESQTFAREAAAKAWLKKQESNLALPNALENLNKPDPILSAVIAQYSKESKKAPGKTKKQVLSTISDSHLGSLKCSEIDSTKIVNYAQGLGVQPQTVGNYLSHLASVFTVARPAWGYPLDMQQMNDARTVCVKLGLTSRSNQRSRRPSLEELDKLMNHYGIQLKKRQGNLPMQEIIVFAIFSTRRQDEITRLTWKDLDTNHSEIMVRDMKNPGETIGNDVLVSVPAPALAVIQRQKTKRQARIFPFNSDSISASFTRACQFLGIDDLHFHDLRHEGITRLFEMGSNIPQAAMVSGHRTWASLKRYTHMRQTGDKYANWKWLPLPATSTNKSPDQEAQLVTAEPKMTLSSKFEVSL